MSVFLTSKFMFIKFTINLKHIKQYVHSSTLHFPQKIWMI